MGQTKCNKEIVECEKCRWTTAALSITASCSLAAFKAFIGFVTGSQAVIADAVHSLADALCMIFAVFGMKIGNKPADKEHNYGHGKIEFIVGLLGGLVLLFVSIEILVHAIKLLFFTPMSHIKVPRPLAVWAALFAIYINFVMSKFTMCAAKKLNSAALEVVGSDDLSDVYTSTTVAIAVIGAQFGMPQLDPFGALFVGLLVAKIAIGLVNKNYHDIIDVSVEPEKLQEISRIIQEVPGVKGIHYLRSRNVGSKIWLDVKILVEGNKTVAQADYLSSLVKSELRKQVPDILNVQVALKPVNGR